MSCVNESFISISPIDHKFSQLKQFSIREFHDNCLVENSGHKTRDLAGCFKAGSFHFQQFYGRSGGITKLTTKLTQRFVKSH